MIKTYFKSTCFLLALMLCFSAAVLAQQKTDPGSFVISPAGAHYERSGFYRVLFGNNYRREWTAPVSLPTLYLDTLFGGLISIDEGGSNQTKSLHLKLAGDKEYALRSVDKTLDKVIPKPFYGTFIADVVNDEVSMSNPYGALGVPGMAEAVKINHTSPQYYYLPKQPALDTLKKQYGDGIYLLERRPQGDWSDAEAMGGYSNIDDTEDIFPDIKKDRLHQVDQKLFARSRLLDMLIGDFDRHADQWKWGVRESGDTTFFEAIPTDRDQAFSTKSGIILTLLVRVTGMAFFQKYNDDIQDVKALSTINRLIDRIMTNKMTLNDWQEIARDMQSKLTDDVIEESIKGMPPEIYGIRGKDLITKLKSRREHLEEYARIYYNHLAEESEIVGTEESEYFEVNNLDGQTTQVNLYYIDKNRVKESMPFYTRTFHAEETDEIRLYGLNGEDVYQVNGTANPGIKLRIIGGFEQDSVIDATSGDRFRFHVYDDKANYFDKSSNIRKHLKEDSAVHIYDYQAFAEDKKGLIPHFGYNDADRFFVGLRYRYLNNQWRRKPFIFNQTLDADYSISQKAFSVAYNGLFPRTIGEWDILAHGHYDGVRWINFYGLGNETANITNDRDYYRMRSEEYEGALGLSRHTRHNRFSISGFYQQVKVLRDEERYIYKNLSSFDPSLLQPDRFAGARADYDFASVNDSILPEKGVTFALHARHTSNLEDSDKSYQLFSGNLNFFIPLFSKFSLAIKTGASTIAGSPEFYQYPSVGEPFNLRGFRRERFSGKSTFYNNAELRYIGNIRSYIFNGKAGLLAFIDNGRVWLPNESSDKMHTSYGGGILLGPFNMVSAAFTVAKSDELLMLQMRLGVLF